MTALENEQVFDIASRIAHYSNNQEIESHLGEAQAIVVALRPEHHDDVLLIDERLARTIARQKGLNLSGFPGILLLATQMSFITPEELRAKLNRCANKAHITALNLYNKCLKWLLRGDNNGTKDAA